MRDNWNDGTTWRVATRGRTVVLGPGGEVVLRPKERAVLAALAAIHPSTATATQLIELVWGGDAPASAHKSLHNHVSRIRRVAPDLIAAVPGGYRLGPDAAPDLRLGDTAGRPLDDLSDHPEAEVHRARVRVLAIEADEAHLASLADRGAPETLDALHRAVEEEPYRERRWQLLATALASAGQRRDALLTLNDARRRLSEVGLEPGGPLVELERTILDGFTPAFGIARPAAPPLHPHRGQPFVGRDDELAELDAAWRRVIDRSAPEAVVVSGPAGIGKTRLVDEFCRSKADTDAVRILWGRHRRDAGRAFGAISEALEQLVAAEPGLVPDGDPLRLLLGAGAVVDGAPTDVTRTRLGRALSGLVARLADRPTVWVFDDVQWASSESLSLIHEALDGAPTPILVVATARPDHADQPAAFGEIGRLIGLVDVSLRPFAADEIETLLSGGLCAPVDRRVAAALHLRTGGLPLYAAEIARTASLRGDVDLDDVPVAIREWILQRMTLLDAPLVDVLRAAAVLGQAVDPRLLTTMTGRPASEIAAALDELVANGLLVIDPDGTTVSFSHALTRDIVDDSVGPMAQRLAHVAAGEAVASSRPQQSARIAHHFALGGDPRAHHYAMHAGEHRLSVAAWSHACEQFRIAEQFADDDAARARALVGLGRGLLGAGRADDAADALRGAVDIADRIDDPIVRARAALVLVGRAGRGALAGDEDAQTDVLRRAIEHVERHPASSDLAALRCDLERELAVAMLLTDRADEREQLLRSALDRAESLLPDHADTYVRAVLGFRYARLGPADLDARLGDLDRLGDVFGTRLDPESAIAAEIYRVEDLIRANRPADARHALDRALRRLDDYPDPYWSWAARTWEFVLAFVAGDVDTAEHHSAAALELRSSFIEAHICRAVNLVAIRLAQGRGDEMLPTLEGAVASSPHIPTFRAVAALVAAECGDERTASAHLRWFTDEGVRNLPSDTNRFLGLNVLAHTAWTIGDRSAAKVLRPLIEPYDGQWVVLNCFGGGGATWGPVSLSLSGLALTDGDGCAARRYLDRAAAEADHAPLVRDRIRRLDAQLDAA
ncbi:MAG: AAA family ATPase [Ilumatobacter sp.]|nr:AAA family ATPase [Ilumatobacter sp.]